MLSRLRLLGVCLLTFAILSIALTVPHTAKAAGHVPGQWISKMYTEALGRLPDAGGWQGQVTYFASNDCSATTLRNQGTPIYLSSEYANLNYDNVARVLTLYRGALNREPDSAGLDNYVNQLNSGTSWSTVVNALFNNGEFDALVPAICSLTNGTYHFGTQIAPTVPTSGSGFSGGTGAQLQSLLDSTPAGGTVYLAQKAVVRISSTLRIPSGVTLTTTGQPDTQHYAQMGRLVRATNFGAELVALCKNSSGCNNSSLTHVWVDGQRGNPTNYSYDSINLRIFGGSNITVSGNVFSNTAGWSTFQALGSYEGSPCGSNTISDNLITVYSSDHNNTLWSDGLSIACENATVTGNQIVDATDVGIVLFRASPAIQHSIVRNNRILNAGNPAFGGIVADGLGGGDPQPDFTGSSIDHNTLWTAPNAWFHIALSVGTRAWFGGNSNTGKGASFTDNTTGGLNAQVNTGIAVSGMTNATVQNNTLNVTISQHGSCPQVNVGAAVSAGYGSGNIQAYTDINFSNCIN